MIKALLTSGKDLRLSLSNKTGHNWQNPSWNPTLGTWGHWNSRQALKQKPSSLGSYRCTCKTATYRETHSTSCRRFYIRLAWATGSGARKISVPHAVQGPCRTRNLVVLSREGLSIHPDRFTGSYHNLAYIGCPREGRKEKRNICSKFSLTICNTMKMYLHALDGGIGEMSANRTWRLKLKPIRDKVGDWIWFHSKERKRIWLLVNRKNLHRTKISIRLN